MPKFWIESSEHTGRFEHTGLGAGIEEGALSGIGVANEGDHRHWDRLATLPLLVANTSDAVKLSLDMLEAKIDLAAIGLELSFTGTPAVTANPRSVTKIDWIDCEGFHIVEIPAEVRI